MRKDNYGGYMVAFAGRKYAARSPPAFIANSTYTVTSFTLVLYHPPPSPLCVKISDYVDSSSKALFSWLFAFLR